MTGLFSRRHRGGLRQRLLWTGLVFLGLALFTNTLAGFLYSRAQIKKAAAQLQTEISSRVASDIGDTIKHKKERLLDLAGSLAVHEFGSDVQKLVAFLLLKNDRAFTDIAVMDGSGMEIIKVSERKVYLASDLSDQSEREKFHRAVRGDDYVSPVYTSDKAEPYVTIAVPVRLGPKKIIGVVSGELNLKFLWSIIGDIKFASAGYAYLVDHRGDLIAHKDASLVLKRTNLSQIPKVQEFLRAAFAKDPSPAREGEGITGKPVLSTFARVDQLGWAVVLEEPVEAALAELYKLARYVLLLLVGGLLVGGLIIVWISNKITEPIRELRRGAEIVAAGNLDHRVEIKTRDEIKELGEQFNRMAAELKTSYVALEERVKQRTRELSVLYEITAAVNQSLELEPTLQVVVKKITDIFRSDASRIFLFDRSGDNVELRASFETQPEFWLGIKSFKRGQGIVGRVAETGELLVFENVPIDPRYQRYSETKAVRRANFCFLAAFPIQAKAKPIGTLLLVGQAPRKLAADDMRLLTSVAEQIGVAVENAKLFAEVNLKTAELEAANRELVELSRTKSEFMAAMSHELRTPLNVIIGNADLLRDGCFGDIAAKQRVALEKVLRYSQMLLKLINEVMAMTRLEAKKMSMDVSTFHLEEIIGQVRTYAEHLNYNNQLKIRWQIEENLPPLTTDALKLEEILQNLIGNAFKFTPRGGIVVGVRDLPGERRVEFRVSDTGIGIEADALGKIFDQFYQHKEAHTGSYSGVGLGLSIVKKYLELMGGEIRVESRPREGSTFTVTLPYCVEPPG